jgi:protein-tyrosine-phosphatase
MGEPRVVLFVCEHGALRSRLAAAFFNQRPPPGWRAASAGLQPQEAVSEQAAGLAAAGGATGLLDLGTPLAVADVPADLVVTVDCDLPGAQSWRLDSREVGEAMSGEIRQRAHRLAEELGRQT